MNIENISIPKLKSNVNYSYWNILNKSVEAGIAGASSMALHVVCLMWMRTTLNYQYRHGGGFVGTLSTLFH
jgi:hypothetical protein